MVTHDLVQRGLSFDDAYAAARALRDRISHREEISTDELKELIEQQVAEMFGAEQLARLGQPPEPVQELRVTYRGETSRPFSRGLLARSIYAAGVDFDRAYNLVIQVQAELRKEEINELSSEELARRVGDFLERTEGEAMAAGYRMIRHLHGLPRPMVIYLGGATGTGKSTLALELAPLLRIYRINATDTIRQVMRMVFSPAILPALHSSSFEIAAPWEMAGPEAPGLALGEVLSDSALIDTFEEQATRVCVGVRAVVERAVAENMSIMVEGVHLVPPFVPFEDLEGAVYQIPLILTTLDEEIHRTRFLTRARYGGRLAERYLENFASIRRIHEHVLQTAEACDLPLLDTSEGEATVLRALRLVTGLMQKRLPSLGESAAMAGQPPVPTLTLFIDGLPDRPVKALGGVTPLQVAHTPTLDRLAREGCCGLADPISPGVVPDTAGGSLAMFGQSPLAMKRGPVEVLGSGLELRAGDVALRANFATVNERGMVIDRRAGRIREGAEELASALDRLPLPDGSSTDVVVRVRATTEHRLGIVLRGDGLSSAILGSDPGDGPVPRPALVPRPVDPNDSRASHTARLLALFEQEALKVLGAHPLNRQREAESLPVANALLSRGAGHVHRLLPLERGGLPLRLTCISADRTVLGVAAWLGGKTIREAGMTANLDTDLEVKFRLAAEGLKESDLVLLHVKGADIAAHDRRPDLKVSYLERVDQALAGLLERHDGPLRIAVASDHATVSESGLHGAEPVPVLIWGEGIEADAVERFDEQAVAAGSLHRFPLQLLLSRLFEMQPAAALPT
jgi:2,3-bisphosphoglycerate-independent phosphoglycerate mutase